MAKQKILAILVLICIVISFIPPIPASAAGLHLIYNGNSVHSGGSIHYTGSNATFTVNNSTPGFNLYMNGEFYQWTSNSYMDITLTNPPTSVTFRTDDPDSLMTVNFYKNTVIDPDATLSYQSYRVFVEEVSKDNDTIAINQEFAYDGVTDTGIDSTAFNQVLYNKGLTGGLVHAYGYIYVHVFVDGTPVGDYKTNTGEKISGSGPSNLYSGEFTWGSVAGELMQRGSWEYSHNYTPPVQAVPEFEIHYNGENKTDSIINVDDTPYYVNLKDKSTNANSWKWYIKTKNHSDFTLLSTDPNPSGVAVWADSTTQFRLDINGSSSLTKTHSITAVITGGGGGGDEPDEVVGKGIINIRYIDLSNGAVIKSSYEQLIYGSYTKTYVPIPGYTFDGSDKSYTTSTPNSENRNKEATSQSVELSATKTKAWIIFYYMPTSTNPGGEDPEEPEEPEQPTLPPVAVISIGSVNITGKTVEVKAGDDIEFNSYYSYSPSGTISQEGTKWQIYDGPGYRNGMGYAYTKNYDNVSDGNLITLTVTDSLGKSATARAWINVLPPYPTAIIDYTSSLIENRVVHLDASKSTTPKKFPIDHTKTTWQITPVSVPSGETDIRYPGQLKGAKKDILIGAVGIYKITLTVTNSYGSNTTSTIAAGREVEKSQRHLSIAEDPPPVPNLSYPSTTYREYKDSNGKAYGITPIKDLSYCTDGGSIRKFKVFYKWDSKNLSYSNPTYQWWKGEPMKILYDSTTNPTGNNVYYTDRPTIKLFDKATRTVNLAYPSILTDPDHVVGRRVYGIWVQKDIPANDTIPELLLESDYKTAQMGE